MFVSVKYIKKRKNERKRKEPGNEAKKRGTISISSLEKNNNK